MKYFIHFIFIATLLNPQKYMAQDTTVPYQAIESYPENYSAQNVVSRMLDGLGYRYHWASKGLREVDLTYEPGNEGKSTIATLKHIYELSQDALLLSEGKVFKRPRVTVAEMPFEEMRAKTCENIYKASANFRAMDTKTFEGLKVTFSSSTGDRTFELWHYFNGQLADALYHTGQIASFRRSSGNPVPKEMNVFMGN